MRGKKTGGRVAGTPNKATPAIREFAQKMLGQLGGKYWTRIKTQLEEGTIHPTLEAKLWAYAYGEPKQEHNINTGITVNIGYLPTSHEQPAITIEPISKTTLGNDSPLSLPAAVESDAG